jgi:hypothetical protein
MPNEYSNFTNDDVTTNPTQGYQGQPNGPPNDTTDSVWDPNMYNPQTQRNGAYVKRNTQTAGNAADASNTFVSGNWGGTGNMVDGQGNDIAGTSGAAQDVNRYRHMGDHPQYANGPQIDQTASGESRAIGMDGLGLLKQTATGAVPSAAEQLGTKQAADAMAAQAALGGSIRGGGMARAAASRGAINNMATIDQTQRQANLATRAGEMAGARAAYLGAATGQRGEDLGLASSQAGLDAGQRASNDQTHGFYEDLSQATKNAQVSHQLGRTAADDAAANAARSTALAGDQASQQRAWRNVDTATGAVQGGVGAYQKVTASPDKPAASTDNSNPDPDTTDSDENMKNVTDDLMTPPSKPISDKEAARLMHEADAMQAHTEGQRAAFGMSTTDTEGNKSAGRGEVSPKAAVKARVARMADQPNPYDAAYEPMYGKTDDAKSTDRLHAAIEHQIEADRPAPSIIRQDPYAPQSLFGHAEKGYAKSRAGQPGYMFGGAPRASWRDYVWGPGQKDAQNGLAPGSDDFVMSQRPHTDKFSAQIMTSDVHAKREAFIDGMNHADRMQQTGEVPAAPSYMDEKGQKRNAPTVAHHAASTSAARADGTTQRDRVMAIQNGRDDVQSGLTHALIPGVGPVFGAGEVAMGAHTLAGPAREQKLARDIVQPTRSVPAVPGLTSPSTLEVMQGLGHGAVSSQEGYQAALAKPPAAQVATMQSDERTKRGAHTSGPMATSNRSMAPSVYEYKDEFAARNGQHVGEKNVGPMAQNLEADPIASTAVITDPKTGLKSLSIPKSLKLTMGGLASLQHEVDELKKKRR